MRWLDVRFKQQSIRLDGSSSHSCYWLDAEEPAARRKSTLNPNWPIHLKTSHTRKRPHPSWADLSPKRTSEPYTCPIYGGDGAFISRTRQTFDQVDCIHFAATTAKPSVPTSSAHAANSFAPKPFTRSAIAGLA